MTTNIPYLREVWRPDIVLYNFAGQEYGSNEMSTFIQVGKSKPFFNGNEQRSVKKYFTTTSSTRWRTMVTSRGLYRACMYNMIKIIFFKNYLSLPEQ